MRALTTLQHTVLPTSPSSSAHHSVAKADVESSLRQIAAENMDILWANSDLTVEAKQLGATAWKAAEHFEEAATLMALPVRRRP